MHNYSFGAPVVTVCAVFTDGLTDGRTDGQTDTRRTTPDDISTAELKALSCAKNALNIYLCSRLSLKNLPRHNIYLSVQ